LDNPEPSKRLSQKEKWMPQSPATMFFSCSPPKN
jgi:hypothetical protein